MQWQGVMPAITTPFTTDGALDRTATVRLIENMLKHRCTGIIPAGSLGEGTTLTLDEKVELFEICVEATAGKVPVVATIAAASTRDAIKLAEAAVGVGAKGLMVLPPYLHQGPQAERDAHLDALFEAANGLGAECMIYNNPPHTGQTSGPRQSPRSLRSGPA